LKPEILKNILYGLIIFEFILLIIMFFKGRNKYSELEKKFSLSEGDIKKSQDEVKTLNLELSKIKRDLESYKSQVVKVSSRMVKLQSLSTSIGSSFDLNEIFESLIRSVQSILEAKSGYVLVYRKEENLLRAVAAFGSEEEKLSEISNAMDEGIIGKAYNINGAISEIDFKGDYKLKEIAEKSINPVVIAAPIAKRQMVEVNDKTEEQVEILGILCITEMKHKRRAVTVDDMRLTDIICNMTAMAIKNANLFRTVKIQSITDGLTKLYNHRYFQNFLSREIERSSRYDSKVSLIITDIDHFKRFNDTYGHQAGDYVLIETAKVIKDVVREVDLPARYGGEEFCVVFPSVNAQQAFRAAERIRTAIEKKVYDWKDQKLSVTTSIGVACYPDDADAKEKLIKLADAALYVAKESGRNKTVIAQDSRVDISMSEK
jgi:diguanylate cyclase (GGDEF)-like protein